MDFFEILKAVFLGIVEGITEWLPVSSTGHMIIVDQIVSLNVTKEFRELFLVVIQLGAILAVVVNYFGRLWPFGRSKSSEEKRSILSLWAKVIVGAIPAAVMGVFLDDLLDMYLMNEWVVAAALIVYGIAFIVIERLKSRSGSEYRITSAHELTYKDALKIGAYQVLSLIPGTSRSGSTILGGMLTGVDRKTSAEFSFFMAIPIMLGASGLKVLKFVLSGHTATAPELLYLAVGMVVAFAVSLLAIRFLTDFVKKHTFAPFGVYRIILGVAVILWFAFAG